MTYPIAIGGIGGSGTRVGARFLQLLGFSIGADLNDELDNLWFTLLFKYRSVLALPRRARAQLVDAFVERMSSGQAPCAASVRLAAQCAAIDRLQHDSDWLRQRAESFASVEAAPAPRWGWKEPNTHLVVEDFLDRLPQLRYVHFYRNPLAVAFGRNQNQLRNWGPILLNRDIGSVPSDSLSYWCAVDRRIRELAGSYASRVLLLSLDDLCANPAPLIETFCAFCGISPTPEQVALLAGEVSPARASRPIPPAALEELRREDLAYLEARGLLA